MKQVQKVAGIIAILLFGIALVACGTAPSEASSSRGTVAIKPAPLVEGGADVFFDQVSENPMLIDPLLAKLKSSPRQALLTIIDYGESDRKGLQQMSLAQLRIYVTPFVNILDTTQKMTEQRLTAQAGLQYYYMEHGEVKTIDYNTLWDLYLLGITPVRDTAPSELARYMDDVMGTNTFPYVPL